MTTPTHTFKPGDGVEIYPIQAPGLRKFDDAKYAWLDVSWDIDARSNDRFPCRLEVNCMNEPGALAQIAKVIGERDANIDNLHMDRGSNDFVKMTIDLQVWDLKHLTNIITLLRGLSVVSSVTRIFG